MAIGQAETALQEVGLDAQQHLPFLASLLDLNLPEERYPVPSLSPPQKRQRTLASLTELCIALSDLHPVLLVVEDLHWVDPSTLEWLGLLLEQVPTRRLLLLLTSRPEFASPWTSRSYLTQLTLNRLMPPQSLRMVASMVGDRPLPAVLTEQIVAHSDGVPLFIEELTRSVLDSGSTVTIPTTLQEVLMARLDQVGEGRRTAQLAAVMGRQFSYALLHAVSPLDEPTLQHDLRCLVERELLYQRGIGDDAVYLFKHALVQDAAYASLVRRTRQHYHRRIAQVLEEQFPESKAMQPEVLAHHYTEARLPEQAIPYWQQAGEQAVKRSANAEAIAHLQSGIALLNTLPDTVERTLQELTLQRTLGVPLLAVKGNAAPEVEAVYSRARVLCRQMGDTPHIFPVLYGLRAFYLTRGDLQTAREIAEELLTLVERQQDPALILQGHRALGSVLYFLGEFTAARVHLEQGIALYDSVKHHSHAFVYGADPGVECHAYLAYVLAHLGYPDQALYHCQKAVSLARGLSHVFSLASALNIAVNFHYGRKQWQLLQGCAEELIALATEHGFAQQLANARTIQGFALVRQGQIEAGMRQIEQGLTAFYATGAVLSRPSRFRQLADIYHLLGRVEEGLTCIDEAMADARRSGERHTESDRYRLKGVLLFAQSSDNRAEAEACLRQAIDVAQSRQAKLSELRAAISLARLWQSQGKQQDAYDLLAPLYAWFTEGFDTADLREAKTLLEELTD